MTSSLICSSFASLRPWRSFGQISVVALRAPNCSWSPNLGFHTCTPHWNKVIKPSKIKAKKFPKIYTKTGDKGKSSLFTGERRPKDDVVFEALGTTDELTSHIGLAMEFALKNNHPYVGQLQRVQCILQDIGSCIATPASSARNSHMDLTAFNSRHTTDLEEWIDTYTQELPPLENFILPGGGQVSAQIHVARAVCRRAERCVTPVVEMNECDGETLRYLNRLSDFLFTLARLAARIDKEEETIYRRLKDLGSGYEKSLEDGTWKKKS